VNDAFVSKFIPAGLDPTRSVATTAPSKKSGRACGVTGNIRQTIYEPPLRSAIG